MGDTWVRRKREFSHFLLRGLSLGRHPDTVFLHGCGHSFRSPDVDLVPLLRP